jgi:hypothetical protein
LRGRAHARCLLQRGGSSFMINYPRVRFDCYCTFFFHLNIYICIKRV